MKITNLKGIVVPILLTLLMFAAFWLYVEWDRRRFQETVFKELPAEETRRETAATRPVENQQELRKNAETAVPGRDTDWEPPESSVAEEKPQTAVAAEAPTDPSDSDTFFDRFLEETAANAVTSGDFTDVPQEMPYDMAVVKSGFDDYNAFLQTDPEYAYKRLSDAFIEQYGENPDVYRLVELIKVNNEGPTRFDKAIEFTETAIRLMSKIGLGPPEALESLELHLEMLREHQQLGLEQGTEPEYRNIIHVGE